MIRKQKKVHLCVALVAGVTILAGLAHAADDTARFYGTWKTSFLVNGQSVTMISIHDANGYKNFIVQSTGNTPAGEGTFSAVNGKWTANAPPPNNTGRYFFLGNNTAICTNAIGQKVTWRRQKSMQSGPAPAPPNPDRQPVPSSPPPTSGGNTVKK